MNLNQKLYQVSQLAKWAGRNNDFEKNAVAAAAAAAIPWGPIILGGLGTAGLLGLLKNLFNVDGKLTADRSVMGYIFRSFQLEYD